MTEAWVGVASDGTVVLAFITGLLWLRGRLSKLENGNKATHAELRHQRFCSHQHIRATRRIGRALREHILREDGESDLSFDDLEYSHEPTGDD